MGGLFGGGRKKQPQVQPVYLPPLPPLPPPPPLPTIAPLPPLPELPPLPPLPKLELPPLPSSEDKDEGPQTPTAPVQVAMTNTQRAVAEKDKGKRTGGGKGPGARSGRLSTILTGGGGDRERLGG